MNVFCVAILKDSSMNVPLFEFFEPDLFLLISATFVVGVTLGSSFESKFPNWIVHSPMKS